MSAVATTLEPAASPRPPGVRTAAPGCVAGLVGRSWLWFIVGCLLVTLVPMLFGWRPYVIESGSMEPRIGIGDVVLASPVAAADQKELLGRVTVFDSPEVPGKVITHRVVRLEGDTIVTKGDANQSVDSAPDHDVVGPRARPAARALGGSAADLAADPAVAVAARSSWRAWCSPSRALVRDQEDEEPGPTTDPDDGDAADPDDTGAGRRRRRAPPAPQGAVRPRPARCSLAPACAGCAAPGCGW